jgi:hypothetical protein
MEVYSVDEGLGSAIKRVFGGKKKKVEAPKPESRGAELRRRYNVGPEKSDTSAKRQILNRSRARKERDEERYGDSVYTKKVAQQSADAHDRYLRAGYSKYGASDARGSGNKARRRAAALQREEYDIYDIILSHLLDEGYAETPESAEVIMVNMSEEWRENIMEREYGPDEILPGSGRTPKQKYRAKRGRFMKSKKPSQNETGRQRAQRMAQNYYIGTTKQQYDNFGIGN